MDLKFINSEHFFILAACIKECDVEDEYEELEKYDFNHFNEISEKIIDKFKTGKNEIFSNEVDHVFFYTYRNEENCLDEREIQSWNIQHPKKMGNGSLTLLFSKSFTSFH